MDNVRLSYTKNDTGALEIIEEKNYYPFGLQHKGYNQTVSAHGNSTAQKYGYNGKGEQDELGLDWLDYGARNYNAALGRFMNIDRFAEKYESINPYQYTFNNPIRFIDVNGDYVYIDDNGDGIKDYRYENGVTQHRVDGEWVNIDENVILSSYALKAIATIDNLSRSGSTGKDLVDYFSGDKNDVTIRKSKTNLEVGGLVLFNLDKQTQLPTTEGMQDAEFHVSLGHELAHRRDKNTRGETVASAIWYGTAKDSEIYATHIENKIRAESGLPLRTHYGIGVSQAGTKLTFYGEEKSRVIDLKGNSRYFDSSDNRITPSPGVAKDVYGGEIYKNRFNYLNRPLNLKPNGIKF